MSLLKDSQSNIVNLDDLLNDPIKLIKETLVFLDMPKNSCSKEVINFVDKDLRHF